MPRNAHVGMDEESLITLSSMERANSRLEMVLAMSRSKPRGEPETIAG